MTTFLRGLAAVLASTLITACGGGSDSGAAADAGTGTGSETPTAAVTGSVVAADSDAPLGAVRLVAGGKETRSAADGSFSLAGIAAGQRVVVRAEAGGYNDAVVVVALAAGDSASARVRLFKASPAQTVDSSVAQSVAAPGSPARVQLPAAALVDAATGAAVTGNVKVAVTPVDPARDPAQMPGAYTTVAAGAVRSIESFGAVKFDLRDAAGRRLNLAPGKTATIRIPLATRSANPPSTVPLFYLDEATGHWVQEGTAALAGSGADRYYEGQVAHFTYWNADQVTETVIVDGCVKNLGGTRLARVAVMSDGVDYSGTSETETDANGRFSIAVRKSSKVSIYAMQALRYSNVAVVTSGTARASVDDCLVIDSTPGTEPLIAPVIVSPPMPASVPVNTIAIFSATVIGSQPMSYQWSCDGADVAGATGLVLVFPSAQLADNGRLCKITARNAAGSAASAGALLTVTDTVVPPLVVQPPANVTVLVGQPATFSVLATGTGPITYQWRRNGATIADAAARTYTTPATTLADNGARFSVVVSNGGGATASAEATLTVLAPQNAPTLTRQPSNQVLALGETATFRVAAIGNGALGYQWARNGVAIAGATDPSLEVTASAADDGAAYRATVTTATGSTVSDAALLVVQAGDPVSRARLLRLGELGTQLAQSSAVALMLADERFAVRSQMCDGGSATLSLDGAGAGPGTTLPVGNHALAATFAGCGLPTGAVATGSASAAYAFTDAERRQGRYTGTAANLRVVQTNGVDSDFDIVVDGSVATVVDGVRQGNVDTTELTYTPAVGATLRSNPSGLVATFTGGSLTMRIVSLDAGTQSQTGLSVRVEYRALKVQIGGVTYTLDGSYQLAFDPSAFYIVGTGVVDVSAGGATVGRLIGSESGVAADVRGPVPALPKSAPRKARR